MKANARSPRPLLLAAGVSLITQSAFSQSPAPAPAAAPPAKFETTKVADGVYTFRNVFLVTSDGVIATDPIGPDARRSRGTMAALSQARTGLRGLPGPDLR